MYFETLYSDNGLDVVLLGMEMGAFPRHVRQSVFGETSRKMPRSVIGVSQVHMGLTSHHGSAALGMCSPQYRWHIQIEQYVSNGVTVGIRLRGANMQHPERSSPVQE